MANRREFIRGGVAATLLAGIGYGPAGMAAGQRRPAVPLYRAIFDERFPDSREFAREVSALGVATRAIRGDITDLWFNDLDLAWRRQPRAVAGLTTESALFCLEQLAMGHRLRVVFRAEHAVQPERCIEHTVSCSRDALEQVRELEKINTGWWAPGMAHVVADVPAGRMPDVTRRWQTPVDGAGNAEFLVSWVIAPARKGEPA